MRTAPPRANRRRLRVRSRLRALRSRVENRNRALPDFLILGAQKGGTSSLFRHLAALPQVMLVRSKEVHYFAEIPNPNNYLVLGPGWYRSHFPLRSEVQAAGAIVGEATPRYMVETIAMTRIARDLPDSRWIIVLRDPIERAQSHHTMFVKRAGEDRRFADVVVRELELIARGVTIPGTTDVVGFDRDYVGGGRYSEQLRVIGALRPDRPTLVLFSENLFEGHPASFALLHGFLGLPEPASDPFPHANASEAKEELDAATTARLQNFYARANADLAEQLQSDRFLTVDPSDWPSWVVQEERVDDR